MQPCVLYFSRTGNTKRMAEAIANSIKTPIFDVTSARPATVENYNPLILGTPVEGFGPTKEILGFIEDLPRSDGKKTILFCTNALWKGKTFKTLEKKLSSKGYVVILSVSKKGIKQDVPADFSDDIAKIKKAVQEYLF